MIINIDDLLKGCDKSVSFTQEAIELPKSDSYDEQVIVNVDGTVTNNDGKYIFVGTVNTAVTLYCDSCLTPFEKKLSFEMSEVFTKGEPEDEQWHFEGRLDLREAVIVNILLNLPMKILCSESCKGLCFMCGQNLNEGECQCDRKPINPKFAEILKLMKD